MYTATLGTKLSSRTHFLSGWSLDIMNWIWILQIWRCDFDEKYFCDFFSGTLQ